MRKLNFCHARGAVRSGKAALLEEAQQVAHKAAQQVPLIFFLRLCVLPVSSWQELSKTQTSFTEALKSSHSKNSGDALKPEAKAIAKAAVEAGELRRKVKDLQEEKSTIRKFIVLRGADQQKPFYM